MGPHQGRAEGGTGAEQDLGSLKPSEAAGDGAAGFGAVLELPCPEPRAAVGVPATAGLQLSVAMCKLPISDPCPPSNLSGVGRWAPAWRGEDGQTAGRTGRQTV